MIVFDYNYIFVEPSFGIGRIMYSIFEHNFKVRDGKSTIFFFFGGGGDNHKFKLLSRVIYYLSWEL